MHACVVLQHSLVAMNNEEKAPMLNVAEYLKKFMPAHSLYRLIWNDMGGDSFDFLRNILYNKQDPKEMHTVSLDLLVSEDIPRLLEEYGPALVSGFRCTEEFVLDKWQHLGEFKGKSVLTSADKEFLGRHAMVLVGYRVVDGCKRYLLQNWWSDKPYVEVDSGYFLSSDASIHFIKEKQLCMGAYPESYEQLVECESGMDASENFLLDG
jgi:hypothetical protein